MLALAQSKTLSQKLPAKNGAGSLAQTKRAPAWSDPSPGFKPQLNKKKRRKKRLG
jgi:hypothetical protein